MPIKFPIQDNELEILYDRLAAYANVIKSVYEDSDKGHCHIIREALELQGVTLENVGIDSNVSRIRIVPTTERT